MCVDAHVTCGPRQRLALSVGDVLFRLWVPVLLRHAEVDDMDDIGRFGAGPANEKIVRLDVSINEVLLVYCLHSG